MPKLADRLQKLESSPIADKTTKILRVTFGGEVYGYTIQGHGRIARHPGELLPVFNDRATAWAESLGLPVVVLLPA